MTIDQLQYLRRVLHPLAGQSWQASADRFNVVADAPGIGRILVANTNDTARAAFVATFDPVTVEALLNEIEQARAT